MPRILKEDAKADILTYKNAKIRFDRQAAAVKDKMDMDSHKSEAVQGDGYEIAVTVLERQHYQSRVHSIQVDIKLDGDENFSKLFDMQVPFNWNTYSFDEALNEEAFCEFFETKIKEKLFRILGLKNGSFEGSTLDHMVYKYSLDELREKAVQFAEVASKIDVEAIKSQICKVAVKLLKSAQTASNNARKYQRAVSNRSNSVEDLRRKAKKSIYDEAPDFEEGGYAYWESRNGTRRVTVLSIDEPNQRAKINTDKGATMYVPLDTLSKDEDGIYDDLDD